MNPGKKVERIIFPEITSTPYTTPLVKGEGYDDLL